MWRAFVNRGDNGDANDTNATIAKIVKLRADRAQLLGFQNHADWRMQDTMAKTPRPGDGPDDAGLAGGRRARARGSRRHAGARPQVRLQEQIEPWDYRYYVEKVRKARYDLSQDEIKPYFELDNMIKGMFWAAGELYGLDFKENTGSVPVFNPDVRTFEVTNRKDGERRRPMVSATPMPATGKRSGAWMTAYRSRARPARRQHRARLQQQ